MAQRDGGAGDHPHMKRNFGHIRSPYHGILWMDQSIHTAMVHENPEKYILQTNEDKPVMLLHTQQPVAEIRDRGLIIKTIKGSIPSVVHQCDRYPNLQKAVYTMYGVGA